MVDLDVGWYLSPGESVTNFVARWSHCPFSCLGLDPIKIPVTIPGFDLGWAPNRVFYLQQAGHIYQGWTLASSCRLGAVVSRIWTLPVGARMRSRSRSH